MLLTAAGQGLVGNQSTECHPVLAGSVLLCEASCRERSACIRSCNSAQSCRVVLSPVPPSGLILPHACGLSISESCHGMHALTGLWDYCRCSSLRSVCCSCPSMPTTLGPMRQATTTRICRRVPYHHHTMLHTETPWDTHGCHRHVCSEEMPSAHEPQSSCRCRLGYCLVPLASSEMALTID